MNSVNKFDDELLIKLVKSNPHLYQAPKNNQHNHVFIRKNLWKQISIELNRDGKENLIGKFKKKYLIFKFQFILFKLVGVI